MVPRSVVLIALALGVAACDSADPDAGSDPDAVLVATVRDASGAPAAGLDVFLTYGGLIPDPARVAARRASEVWLSAVYPSPASVAARVEIALPEPTDVTLRLLDVAGDPLATLVAGERMSGLNSIAIDLSPYPAGVYQVDLSAGGERVRRYALKSDAEHGLAIHLGQTDGGGRLVVVDRRRVPSLFDVPPIPLTDDTNSVLGELTLTREVGIVAQNAQGQTDGTRATLRDGRTDVELTFAP